MNQEFSRYFSSWINYRLPARRALIFCAMVMFGAESSVIAANVLGGNNNSNIKNGQRRAAACLAESTT
ncbi:hypothetical protein [Solimicrobium silvestre]|uniref:hypothetical protein n=1 Tax=Solimicrobium silvestre TaxID=2099400 RepID=UPI00105741B9|nr:hypothetical protein [Solimicrobium silvestre]